YHWVNFKRSKCSDSSFDLWSSQLES
ncbi:unnamed protein product, partial [Allacma fusca]